MTTTIYELPRSLFSRVEPLYTHIPYDQTCYDAIFEGRQNGRIFVDAVTRPTAAIMFRSYEYFVAGSPDSPLRQFIREAPEEPDLFQWFYGMVALNADWQAVLLADLPLEVIDRRNYRWPVGKPAPQWRKHLPPGATIRRIDRKLAQQLDKGIFPVPFFKIFWGNYSLYAKYGFGYCLEIDGEIASIIYALATSHKEALISIETEERFRRRGFAALVAARFIERCLEKGLTPVWDTDLSNVASATLAERLGFVEHEPFAELAFPYRGKPEMTRGLWTESEPDANGVIAWVRAE